MKWSPEYAIGVPEIDEQHQSLFEWFAQLDSAAADHRMMTATYTLTRLMQYTRVHFAAEETLMTTIAYPELETHRAEHEAFRRNLRELQTAAMTQDISVATISLLRDWLIKHITISDMKYAAFSRSLTPKAAKQAR
jgi:hemerythrin